MADEKTTKVILDLDNKEFVKKLKESMGLMNELGEAEGLKSGIDMFLKVGVVAGVAAAAIGAVKVAIDMSEEIDKIKQIDASFEALSKSVGLVGTELKEKLLASVHGLVADTDVIQAANRALVQMGDGAARLPEIMEISRKATMIFGGDLISNFEAINSAIANGNTRMLKQFGIIVDVTEAEKKYAKSIGTTADMLSETGKKHALANAAIAQAAKKFKEVETNAVTVTSSLKKFMAELTNLKETLMVKAEKPLNTLSDGLITIGRLAIGAFKTAAVKMFGSDTENAAMKVDDLSWKINNLTDRIKAQKKWIADHQDGGEALLKQGNLELQRIEAQLGQATSERDRIKGEIKALEPEKKKDKEEEVPEEKSDKNLDKVRELRLKFNKDILNIQRDLVSQQEHLTMSADEADENRIQRINELTSDSEIKKMELRKEFVEKGIITEKEYVDAVALLNEDKEAKIAQIELNVAQDRIDALDRYRNAATSTYDGIARSAKVRGAQATKENEDFGKKGAKVMDIFESHAANAFMELGEGTKDAGDVMKGFFFGALAEMAEMQGRIYLGMGIGGNYAAAAAGAGLLILAGILRGMSKGGARSSSSGAGASMGGGGSGDTIGTQISTPTKPAIEEQKKKEVTVAIHGNYFETEQTRTRLMEMIREAGDFTDFNLKQIGQS